MFDLPRYLMQTHKEPAMNRRGGNQQPPTQRLIQTPDSSAEVGNSSPPVRVLQPNLENNFIPSNVQLGDVAQPNEMRNNLQQDNDARNEGKINITAALLTTVLYICSISLVIYGAIHIKDCPAENMIMISYIVMGSLMLFSRILSSPEECRDIFNKGRNPTFVPQTCCRLCFNLVTQIIVMCFFFALCYWAFHINPDNTEGSPNYCEKSIYKNTYYGCIVGLSILGLGFFLTCCAVCIVACRSTD